MKENVRSISTRPVIISNELKIADILLKIFGNRSKETTVPGFHKAVGVAELARHTMFLIEKNGEFLGAIIFQLSDKINKKVEVNLVFSEGFTPNEADNGEITEAIKERLEVYTKITVLVAPKDRLTIETLKSLGFVQEAVRQAEYVIGTGYLDVLPMTLTTDPCRKIFPPDNGTAASNKEKDSVISKLQEELKGQQSKNAAAQKEVEQKDAEIKKLKQELKDREEALNKSESVEFPVNKEDSGEHFPPGEIKPVVEEKSVKESPISENQETVFDYEIIKAEILKRSMIELGHGFNGPRIKKMTQIILILGEAKKKILNVEEITAELNKRGITCEGQSVNNALKLLERLKMISSIENAKNSYSLAPDFKISVTQQPSDPLDEKAENVLKAAMEIRTAIPTKCLLGTPLSLIRQKVPLNDDEIDLVLKKISPKCVIFSEKQKSDEIYILPKASVVPGASPYPADPQLVQQPITPTEGEKIIDLSGTANPQASGTIAQWQIATGIAYFRKAIDIHRTEISLSDLGGVCRVKKDNVVELAQIVLVQFNEEHQIFSIKTAKIIFAKEYADWKLQFAYEVIKPKLEIQPTAPPDNGEKIRQNLENNGNRIVAAKDLLEDNLHTGLSLKELAEKLAVPLKEWDLEKFLDKIKTQITVEITGNAKDPASCIIKISPQIAPTIERNKWLIEIIKEKGKNTGEQEWQINFGLLADEMVRTHDVGLDRTLKIIKHLKKYSFRNFILGTSRSGKDLNDNDVVILKVN